MTPATLLNQEGDLTTAPCARDNQLAALAEAIGKAVPANDNEPMKWAWDIASATCVEDNYPDVVAFTGVAGSGKSTATRYLVEHHGYTLVKFAGPLKDMMRALGFGEDDIEGSDKELSNHLLCDKSPRHAMQTLGTEWGRKHIGENFWINLWKDTAERTIAQGGRVVTDDCRFPNEAAAIRKLGGDIFKIEGRGGIAGYHVSEAGCGIADSVIDNGGEIASLHKKVVEALERYG